MGINASCALVTGEEKDSKAPPASVVADLLLTKIEKKNVAILRINRDGYRLDLLANQKNGDLVSLKAELSKNNEKISDTDIIVNYEMFSGNKPKFANPSFNLTIYDNGKKISGSCGVIALRE